MVSITKSDSSSSRNPLIFGWKQSITAQSAEQSIAVDNNGNYIVDWGVNY